MIEGGVRKAAECIHRYITEPESGKPFRQPCTRVGEAGYIDINPYAYS